MQSLRGISGRTPLRVDNFTLFSTSKMRFHGASQFSRVAAANSFDKEEGCLAMEKNHRQPGGEIGQQGYEFSGLDGASFC